MSCSLFGASAASGATISSGKRSASGAGLQDASDRAAKHRCVGLRRIPLEQLGFWPGNRGGLGVAGYHSHEVAQDIMVNKMKTERYGAVNVVRVPDERLTAWREANLRKCECDALLPAFSPDMRYACLSKTHFTHANKLGKEGGRMLFNTGKVRIAWQDGDAEARTTRDEGPLCAVYGEGLFADSDAFDAIMGEDNKNAAIQMQEDEMTAFGNVSSAMTALQTRASSAAGSGPDASIDVAAVLEVLKARGGTNFSDEQVTSLIAFRAALPDQVATAFSTCQFSCVGGRVRVKCADFGLASQLDVRAPWTKAAVILFQYIGTLGERLPAGPSNLSEVTFAARLEITAKRLSASTIKELRQACAFSVATEAFVKKMFKTYAVKEGVGDGGKLLDARGRLLSDVGKLVVRAGSCVADARSKASATFSEFTESSREEMFRAALEKSLPDVESRYRKRLVEAGALQEASLKPPLYSKPAPTADAENIEKHSTATSAASASIRAVVTDGDGDVAVSDEDVLRRLGLKSVGGYVRWTRRGLAAKIETAAVSGDVKQEVTATSSGVDESAEVTYSAASQSTLRVQLLALDGLTATIKYALEPLPTAADAADATDSHTADTPLWEEARVPSDTLLPDEAAAKADELPKDVALWPASRAKGSATPLDSEALGQTMSMSTAQRVLSLLQLSAWECTAGVCVYFFNEAGKLPFVLQARATRDFKKGELFLVPYSAASVFRDDDIELRKLTATKNVIHEMLISRVALTVHGSCKSAKAHVEDSFIIPSPLWHAKVAKDRLSASSTVSAYWAVLRTHDESAANMLVETLSVDVPNVTAIGGAKLPATKGHKWSVSVAAMRNSQKISKGDVLCVPFLADVERR